MRQGNNTRRLRGRPNRKQHVSPRAQIFDSHGPDVRIRGNAPQVYEKYLTLARDATSAGNRVGAESYFQFAEHYFRIMNDSTDPQRANPDAQRVNPEAERANPEAQRANPEAQRGGQDPSQPRPEGPTVSDEQPHVEWPGAPGNGHDRTPAAQQARQENAESGGAVGTNDDEAVPPASQAVDRPRVGRGRRPEAKAPVAVAPVPVEAIEPVPEAPPIETAEAEAVEIAQAEPVTEAPAPPVRQRAKRASTAASGRKTTTRAPRKTKKSEADDSAEAEDGKASSEKANA